MSTSRTVESSKSLKSALPGLKWHKYSLQHSRRSSKQCPIVVSDNGICSKLFWKVNLSLLDWGSLDTTWHSMKTGDIWYTDGIVRHEKRYHGSSVVVGIYWTLLSDSFCWSHPLYCTISIDSDVTHHRACGLGQIQSPVPRHNPYGRRLLVDPKNGQKRLLKRYLWVWVICNIFSTYLFKEDTDWSMFRSLMVGWILDHVPGHTSIGRCWNFVHRVTGHTPGRINQNGTVGGEGGITSSLKCLRSCDMCMWPAECRKIPRVWTSTQLRHIGF